MDVIADQTCFLFLLWFLLTVCKCTCILPTPNTESFSVEKKTVALLKQINDLGKKDILRGGIW